MSEPIVSTLTVSFDNNGTNANDRAGNHAITLEQLSKRFDSEGQLTARCFPAEGIEFVTSAGTLIIGEVRPYYWRSAISTDVGRIKIL